MPHRRSIELGIRLEKTSAVAQESAPGLEAYPPTVSFRSFEPFRVRPLLDFTQKDGGGPLRGSPPKRRSRISRSTRNRRSSTRRRNSPLLSILGVRVPAERPMVGTVP